MIGDPFLAMATMAGAPTLSDPELLSFNYQAASPASVASDSINPGNGALIRVIVRHRDTVSSKTHTVPTTTLADLFDFGAGARFQQLWTIESISSFPVHLRVTEFWGYATGATGAGTITAGFSAAPENAAIEVIRYARGWRAAPNDETDTSISSPTLATSIDFQFASAAAASSAAIIAMLNNADNTTRTLPAGWTSITNFSSGFLHAITAFKKGSVGTGPYSVTAMSSSNKSGGMTETLKA